MKILIKIVIILQLLLLSACSHHALYRSGYSTGIAHGINVNHHDPYPLHNDYNDYLQYSNKYRQHYDYDQHYNHKQFKHKKYSQHQHGHNKKLEYHANQLRDNRSQPDYRHHNDKQLKHYQSRSYYSENNNRASIRNSFRHHHKD